MASTILGKCVFAVGAFLATSFLYGGRSGDIESDGDSAQKDFEKQKAKLKAKLLEGRTEAAKADFIDGFPGLDEPVSFAQFSGYLDIAPTRHVFYLYEESQNDPENDPVLYWTNGGPGCSGLFAWGTEHGPYFINGDGSLNLNPFSWNMMANIVYFEQPAGVGFGILDTPDLVYNDVMAASDNFEILKKFFERFPERRSNPFYVTSESYGGHYVPQLTLEILNRDPNREVLNMQGYAVGNPWVEPWTNMKAEIETYYYHGLMSKPAFDNWKENCRAKDQWRSDYCSDVIGNLSMDFDVGINPYALDYPVCVDENGHDDYRRRLHGSELRPRTYASRKLDEVDEDKEPGCETEFNRPSARKAKDVRIKTTMSDQVKELLKRNRYIAPYLPAEDIYRPCSLKNMIEYLSRDDVREAIHVSPQKPKPWASCGAINYRSEDDQTSAVPEYKELVDRAVAGEHDYDMVIVSGDDDSVCAPSGTQEWLWELGVPAVEGFVWKPWHVRGQVAGYITKFELGEKTNATFSFITIHGCGHEFPAYKPVESLELLRRYFKSEW